LTAAPAARPAPIRSLLVLSTAAMAFALSQTSIIPAIGELIRTFDTDAAGVAWTITGYLVATAVFTPILGRLGDMFGKRRMLLIALGLFVAGNVVSGFSSSLGVMVAGRVLQGAGGAIFPLCFAIIRDEFPADRVRGSIGLISAIAGIGAAAGLVMGGLLVDHASYRWIFWCVAIAGVAAAIGTRLLVRESPVRTPGRVDVRGAAVLSAGLVVPLIAIAQAKTWGWTGARTILLVAVGLAVLAGWVVLQRRTAAPLANMRTLSSAPVLMTNVATLLTGFGLFGSFILIPQLAEAPASAGYGFGASAAQAGLLILPGALVGLATGPLSSALGTRYGGKVPLVAGAAIAACGLALLGVSHGSQLEVLVFTTILFTGATLTFSAMPNLIVDAVPHEETGEATAFNWLIRNSGAALGTAVGASILAASATAAHPLPTDQSFRTAFLVAGAGALVAAIVSTRIPAPAGSSAAADQSAVDRDDRTGEVRARA
jgi:MFS family permease